MSAKNGKVNFEKRKNVVENKKLIFIVKRFPQLYDSEHKDYLQQKATDEAWRAVAESWGKSAAKCKDRFRDLRAAYARSINAYKTQRGTNRGKLCYLTKEMEFLRPYIRKEAAAFVADNTVEVVSDSESDALEPSTSRANHSTVWENENHKCGHFIQNIQRQIQSINQSQKKTFLFDSLKKFAFALVIDTMEEQELRVLQQNLQDRLNQSGDTLNTTQDDEVLVIN
ncbi:uncharacterized protein LOC128919765 [Zeugodacus cucurbitae]|uniref:uncharacterized protein LOC128919765 n=1 Tax=Zeugodacus cucurbitae TaxID=28588 RepID=UPI000596A44E|nr:uncharacterized protein LOC128919765 [Zeugodacus cucurbitae]